MDEEGDFMTYSRVKKYQQLRDGLKDEAGITKEQIQNIESDEDDDFLSFIKKDNFTGAKINMEDTLTEPKTFEQMREESSEELEQALRSAKKGVGKESQYNTRMDILSKIRDGEKATIRIDAVDQYSTDEFARGMFLNEDSKDEESTHNGETETVKKMTLMEKLASISPEEDAKKAHEFLQEEKKKEIEQEIEEDQNIIEPEEENIDEEENVEESINDNVESVAHQEATKEFRQIENKENHQVKDKDKNKGNEKKDGKVVKVLDIIITILVIILIVLLCIIIYQNFF